MNTDTPIIYCPKCEYTHLFYQHSYRRLYPLKNKEPYSNTPCFFRINCDKCNHTFEVKVNAIKLNSFLYK